MQLWRHGASPQMFLLAPQIQPAENQELRRKRLQQWQARLVYLKVSRGLFIGRVLALETRRASLASA